MMTIKPTIICVGDLCCDLIVPYGKMQEALVSGDISKEVTSRLQVRMQCGGSVGNVARHLGRMGAGPVFITPVKKDALGIYLSEQMEKLGVNMHWSVPASRSNMYCVAVLDQSGERTMFCFVPPWADFPRFQKGCFANVPQFPGQILFTSGMAMLEDSENNEAVLEFFTQRKAAGAKIVFDLNVRAESYGYEGERKRAMERMIALSDIVLGSGGEEFDQVTGQSRIPEAAEQLQRSGAKAVIARDGANPVLVLDGEKKQYISVKPVKPVSTLGAGDSFDAMFLECIAPGEDLLEAVRRASDYAGAYISGQQPEDFIQQDSVT